MIVQIYQDPLYSKDIKCTEDWDIIMTETPTHNRITMTAEADSRETLMQILSLCLRTKKGQYAKNLEFGAMPGKRNFMMTEETLSEIKSFILLNLRSSWFNSANYPIDVDVFPAGKDSIAIQIYINITRFGSSPDLKSVNFIFNQSTSEIKPVKNAFGA
jgi:hypothetical protein